MRVFHLLPVVLFLAFNPLCYGVHAKDTHDDTVGKKETETNVKSLRRRTKEKERSFLGKVGGFFENVAYTLRTMVSPSEREFDIIIIGAGAAGLSAATEILNLAPDKSFIILESTDRIGGRVRSSTMGATGKEVVVEDGANWLHPAFNNPLIDVANDIGLAKVLQDFTDLTIYNQSGSLIDGAVVEAELQTFEMAATAAEAEAEKQFTPNHENFPDNGVIALLQDAGYNVTDDPADNFKYLFQWAFVDFEYGTETVSVRDFPYREGAPDPMLVFDQRGFEAVLQEYSRRSHLHNYIFFDKRVESVEYDDNFCRGCNTFKARVKTTDGTEYYAHRVISTVSVGVLNNDLITWDPPLEFPHEQFNPLQMNQYVKIFYQFDTVFWDDTEFVEVVRDVPERGHCHHWQNMDKFLPGSGLIRCELMTEAFLDLIDPVTQELSDTTLSDLLEPLRLAYGSSTVGVPLDIYYPKLNKDVDFGFGAYSSWKIGKTFTDYAKFFGNKLVGPCEHNGCNSDDEWILYLSGTASCWEFAEWVHGAIFGGARSARLALDSLGEDVDTLSVECGDITLEMMD